MKRIELSTFAPWRLLLYVLVTDVGHYVHAAHLSDFRVQTRVLPLSSRVSLLERANWSLLLYDTPTINLLLRLRARHRVTKPAVSIESREPARAFVDFTCALVHMLCHKFFSCILVRKARVSSKQVANWQSPKAKQRADYEGVCRPTYPLSLLRGGYQEET